MYNTADYIDLDCYNARPILRSRPILPKKKEKEVHKLLGIVYSTSDNKGNEWYYLPLTKKFVQDSKPYRWCFYCNESDFEDAYIANPFSPKRLKVKLQFNLIFD